MWQLSTFYGMWTERLKGFMKSQDILLPFKMVGLHAQEERFPMADKGAVPIMTDVSRFMEDALATDHLTVPRPGIASIPEAIVLEPYSNWGMLCMSFPRLLRLRRKST